MLIAFKDGSSVPHSGAHTSILSLFLSLRTMQAPELTTRSDQSFLAERAHQETQVRDTRIGGNVNLDACWFSHTQKVK